MTYSADTYNVTQLPCWCVTTPEGDRWYYASTKQGARDQHESIWPDVRIIQIEL